MIQVRWLGTAGIEFSYQGRVWLIDPFFTRPGKFASLFGRVRSNELICDQYLSATPGKIEAIFVGHSHLDHALDVPYIAKKTGASVFGGKSMQTLMRIHGIPDQMRVVAQGDKIDLSNGFRMEIYESRHGRAFFGKVPFPGEIDASATIPLKASQYKHGTVFIFVFHWQDLSFGHLGSAELIESNLSGAVARILFLCAAGRQFTDHFVVRAMKVFNPSVVAPIHFDDFSVPIKQPLVRLPGVNLEGMIREIRAASASVKVITPDIMSPMPLEI